MVNFYIVFFSFLFEFVKFFFPFFYFSHNIGMPHRVERGGAVSIDSKKRAYNIVHQHLH